MDNTIDANSLAQMLTQSAAPAANKYSNPDYLRSLRDLNDIKRKAMANNAAYQQGTLQRLIASDEAKQNLAEKEFEQKYSPEVLAAQKKREDLANQLTGLQIQQAQRSMSPEIELLKAVLSSYSPYRPNSYDTIPHSQTQTTNTRYISPFKS